jgi:hypothetical protein
MNLKSVGAVLLATAALTGAFAANASALAWKFNGSPLAGSETVLNRAGESGFTIPGLTTSCKPFVFVASVSNPGGAGTASVTEVPLKNCFTNSKSCTVKTISAETLPWAGKLTTVGVSNYLVIQGIKVSILYAGEECALGGVLAVIKGTAGGLIDNETESVTFNSSSFAATKTELKALGAKIEWSGVFTMIATGAHIGESISVS